MTQPIKTKEDFEKLYCDNGRFILTATVKNHIDYLWPHIEATIHKAKVEAAVDAGNEEYKRASKIGFNAGLDEAIEICNAGEWGRYNIIEKLKDAKHG